MKNNLLIFILLTGTVFLYANAWSTKVDGNCMAVNLTDSLGRKDGIWAEKDLIHKYKDGKEQFMLQIGSSCIDLIVHYDKSIISFYPSGVIAFFITKIEHYKDVIGIYGPLETDTEVERYYKGYEYKFYENGSIKAEGWVIFEDVPGDPVGEWKFYNTNGDVKEVRYCNEPPYLTKDSTTVSERQLH